MSRGNQQNLTFEGSAPQSVPIARLPTEVLMKVFKTYAESYPAVRDQRVVDLCLVSTYWNAVANDTPQLWTKINLTFPFADHHLAAMLKRVHASKLEKIDISIDFCDPGWDGYEPQYDISEPTLTKESIWVQDILTQLRNTEKRWKSIEVVSEAWLPLHKLMEGWTFTKLPSLESISMKRDNYIFGMQNVRFDPVPLIGPMTLFGQNASLPRLCDLSLSAVHIDWDDASVTYQNLRKLEINNITYDVGPSFEQFAAMLSSSPRLEYLDVSGFCPEHYTGPAPPAGEDPEIPVVHLPELKEFTFGWKNVDLGYDFLQMFQIGNSLESLTLIDTESSPNCWKNSRTGVRHWVQDSEGIFEALYHLGSEVPRNEDDMPPSPFISMCGVKRLRIISTRAAQSSLIDLLKTLTELEEIWLEDVDTNVLEDVTSVQVKNSGATGCQPLRRLDLRWTWEKGVPSFAEPSILQLKSAGIEATVQAAEDWQVGQGW